MSCTMSKLLFTLRRLWLFSNAELKRKHWQLVVNSLWTNYGPLHCTGGLALSCNSLTRLKGDCAKEHEDLAWPYVSVLLNSRVCTQSVRKALQVYCNVPLYLHTACRSDQPLSHILLRIWPASLHVGSTSFVYVSVQGIS